MLYDFKVKNAKHEEVSLSKFQGQVLLIVNVASECGFTPQYDGLQKLQTDLAARGFTVLGFPCNQFGAQEKGSDDEIQKFCMTHFGVNFPVFAKIEVNGNNAHPLYKWLKEQAPGLLGTEGIKWNFTKFLIDRKGRVVKRFAPQDKPESLKGEIEELL